MAAFSLGDEELAFLAAWRGSCSVKERRSWTWDEAYQQEEEEEEEEEEAGVVDHELAAGLLCDYRQPTRPQVGTTTLFESYTLGERQKDTIGNSTRAM